MSPALSPTRGSGFGAVADVLTLGDVPSFDIDDEVERAQAPASKSPAMIGSADRRTTVARTTVRRARKTDAIASTSRRAV